MIFWKINIACFDNRELFFKKIKILKACSFSSKSRSWLNVLTSNALDLQHVTDLLFAGIIILVSFILNFNFFINFKFNFFRKRH